jgi:hypothetical protein
MRPNPFSLLSPFLPARRVGARHSSPIASQIGQFGHSWGTKRLAATIRLAIDEETTVRCAIGQSQ